MLLHDSMQLRCPHHATSHRNTGHGRRGGTWRWLLTSLGHVVCLGKSCVRTPKFLYVCRRATPLTSRLSLWVASTVKKNIFVFMVRGQKLTKHLRVKFLLKTDGGYPRDAGFFFHPQWQILGVLSALTPIFFVTTKNY